MRQALDTYDDMPKYMKQYLRNYGWHFNKALCNYAVSLMKKGGQKLEPVSKEYVDKTLEQYNQKRMQVVTMYSQLICVKQITMAVV